MDGAIVALLDVLQRRHDVAGPIGVFKRVYARDHEVERHAQSPEVSLAAVVRATF